MLKFQVIDAAALDALTAEACESPRGRKNRNLHHRAEDPCHRLLNAIEPRSYVAPHCHADPSKDETLSVLRGRVGLVRFDAWGGAAEILVLGAGALAQVATIPAGSFHSLVSLEEGTVLLEAKAGPYQPPQAHERADWAPAEGDPRAAEYLEELRALFAAESRA
ncbi:MAG: WbuC family cupin fold metalloprotein [Planctomycetota bacterium]